jgi:metal-sulfur cluster biosynthetic enzyme
VTEPVSDIGERLAEIRGRLRRVTDPELDEPVTELGFITGIAVEAGAVAIGFRLPTYFCAANFAFLMADDMRREVAAIPWVTGVTVTLGDHMYAKTINRGLAGGLTFQEAFGAEASGGLEALRETFRLKAFQRRQEALLRHLLSAGHSNAALASLTLAELASLPLEAEGERLRQRYIERRAAVGAAPAFVDAAGAALDAGSLPGYLRSLARIGINAEFNGAICRGLLAARFGEVPPTAATAPT